MKRLGGCILVLILLTSVLSAAPSPDGENVWKLEEAYWAYVKANDLQQYLGLWHSDFLGWPSVNPEPLRKDHITDWIANHTSKGETLKSYDLERLTTQVTGNVVTVTYRVRLTWGGPNGPGQPATLRIIHTWLRSAAGGWQIISGMSCPANAEGH